ncbi:M23 family metallopeptidase [Pedobacter psychrodurus]|uniref:M23 family metallopeptidase n=1 Tax=Pedobacter psychrodurus TaxID=2530456 RepID=A0A4R0PYZ9_9SPHI|nr:M23 family metallopeptidase [Pedobacter psychrodurus]TCD25565.1 M23 family metallopeptidase [Pedobacter psychrodurus]
MIKQLLAINFLLGLGLLSEPLFAQNKETISLSIHQNPSWIKINRTPTLYYELQIKNSSADTMEIKTLKISGHHKNYLALSGEKLAERTKSSDHKNRNLIIPAGGSCVIYVELENQVIKSKPILNRLEYYPHHQGPKGTSALIATTLLPTTTKPTVLGKPLQTGLWTAIYDPAWTSGHRRVFYSEKGKQYLPGRFAIDFIRVDSTGKYAIKNTDSIKNWLGYKNAVIAVADGIVSSVQDDFNESATVSQHKNPAPDQASGNYVSIKIAEGKYVFYEHLNPNSIRVKPGEKVKKGDIIAQLGFTGQSTGPHLHFHLADRDSRLYAEGLPYVFEHFFQVGRYSSLDNFGNGS